MSTQVMDESNICAKQPLKRFPAVATQCTQPANTPEWSIAARLPEAEIERFEKQQAELKKSNNKKTKRLRKHRFLFATSSDEDFDDEEDDDDDDDLEFDFEKPTERKVVMPAKVAVRRKNTHYHDDDDDEDDDDDVDGHRQSTVNSKPVVSSNKDSPKQPLKRNHDVSSLIPDKMKKRRLSVKVSRDEVKRIMENEAKILPTLPRPAAKKEKSNLDQVDAPRHRGSRQKKTEPDSKMVESRHSKRTKQHHDIEDAPKKKKHKEVSKATVSKNSKNVEAKASNSKKTKTNEYNYSVSIMQQFI